MATLIDAVLARNVELDASGIKSISNRIVDNEEFVCDVPSDFSTVLAIKFSGEPHAIFPVATEVRSYLGKPLWFDSGKLQLPASGLGEFALAIPIPVRDVGPCLVSLRFDGKEVWSQHVFFTLS